MGSLTRWLAVAACTAIFAGSAQATPISGIGNPGDFAGITNVVVRDFESVAPGDTSSLNISGVTFTGQDMTGLAGPVGTASDMMVDRRVAITTTTVWPGPYPPGYETSGGFVYFVTDGKYNTQGQSLMNGERDLAVDVLGFPDIYTTQFRFDFAAPVQFFAMNLGGLDNDWTLSTYDEDDNLLEMTKILAQPVNDNSGAYHGFMDAGGIAYALLTDTFSREVSPGEANPDGELILIDNFTTGSLIAPVPLPAGMPLLLGALAAFGLAGWRSSRNSADA